MMSGNNKWAMSQSILVASLWAIVTALVVSLFISRAAYRAYTNPLSSLPGPWYTKWTDIVEKYYYVKGKKHEYVHMLHQKYGPIVRSNPDEVDVSDVEAVRTIHKASRAYLKSDWYLSLAPPGVRTLMNITEPDMHTSWRRLLGGPFQDNYLQKLEPVVSEKMALALDKMDAEMKKRGSTDILRLWMYMTLDIITEISYGASVNILQNQEENQYMMDYLNGLGPIHAIRTTMPLYVAIASWLRFPMFARLLNIGPRVNKWAADTLKAYKSLLQDENPKPTLFTPLFANGDKGFTDRQILDLAGSNITAGTHTTASTLSFMIWAICKNPEIRDKIVAEVSKLPIDFIHQDTRDLPYLNRTMKEAVRLYAGVPSVLPRTVPPGGARFVGHFVPEGTSISTQCYSLHRREDYFPEPQRFDPDRWISPTKEMNDAFMGFGAGVRSCVGINLAQLELRCATAHFFRRWPQARVSSREGMSDKDMGQEAWVFMSPSGHRCLIEGYAREA